MDDQKLELLGRKIQEAVSLIQKLRSENLSLKDELESVRKNLDGQKKQVKKGAPDGEKAKIYREDLERFKNERIQVKQKIRSVLRRIEAINIQEEKVQKDLFGRE